MESLSGLTDFLLPGLPLAATLVLGVIALIGARKLLDRRYSGQTDRNMKVQLFMLLLSFVLLVVVIVVSPVGDTQKGQILSLVGIVLSAAIALSSTTFVGNIMAGLMTSAVKPFRVGDFVSVGEQFGRVTERGLFHVEIQTEQRDLVTLPNLHLVTNPVKVVRASGTIVSAGVSLGYDVPRDRIKAALLRAAEAAELQEPFVRVDELGDFSVLYRVSGLLTEVKQLLTARSRLRGRVLDALHADGIEIVSPNFMNTRQIEPGIAFIPKRVRAEEAESEEALPENVVFDKAEEAETLEQQRARLTKIDEDLKETGKAAREAEPGPERERLERRLEVLRQAHDRLSERLDAAE